MNRRAWKRSLRNQFNQQRKFAARQSWSTTTNPILRHLALWWESFLVGEYEFSSADRLKRLTTLSLVLVAALGAVSVRLYYLQSKDSLRWTSLATKQQEKRISVNEARGTIYDAAGRALAVSLPTVSLGANPNRIKSPEQKLLVAQKLAPIIALSDSALLGMLNSPKSFVWLVRDLPAGVADEVAALKLVGIEVVPEFKRFYPQGETARQLVGFVSRDGQGQSGVERTFEKRISGERANFEVRRDARGRLVAPHDQSAEDWISLIRPVSAQEGPGLASSTAELSRELHDPSAVVMSIDSFIQNVVEEQFSAALIRTKAKHIQGLVMDADTGEILAMAQSPGMNSANKKFDPLQAMKNHVTQDSYEPGSTFKPIVAALALQQKLLRADETMNCENGSYRIGKHTIGDVHPVGVVAFPEVLIRSSNICMAKVGMRLGKQRLHDGLATLGIGQRTGFELPGEARGIFRGANKWAEVDVATHSFGHGVSVTALQLTRAFSAVMNGGILVTPTILKRRVEARAASEVGVRVFDQSVSDTLREILVGVTEDEHGTGNNAAILGVKVAGKTGTAQKLRQGARGYDSSRVVASFIGFVDGRDLGIQRRLTMVVVVDEPGVMPRWGGAVAAPVFKLAMERIISHLMTDPRQSPAGPAEKRSA